MTTSAYPFTLSFNKVFTKGTLKGLTLSDTIGHVSEERAKAWLEGVAENYKRGVLDYYVENPVLKGPGEEGRKLPKGFVQWVDANKDAFYWTNGKDVFRSTIHNAIDVATGYTLGRWESTVEHWNHYAAAFGRTKIA